MPRRPAVDRPIKLTTTLPESIRARLDLYLFSEAEGRVPQGAYQEFILDRINEFFSLSTMDTGFGSVRGGKETLEELKRRLEISNGR